MVIIRVRVSHVRRIIIRIRIRRRVRFIVIINGKVDSANARDTMRVCGRRSCSRGRCMRIRCSVPNRMVIRFRNNNNIIMSVTTRLSVVSDVVDVVVIAKSNVLVFDVSTVVATHIGVVLLIVRLLLVV